MEISSTELLRRVGKRIYEARKNRKLTQSQLAYLIGKSQDSISRYEAGTREIGVSEIAALAAALEVPTSHLLDESSAGDALDVANELLYPSFRLAANITVYKYLRLQYILIQLLERRVTKYKPQLNLLKVETTLLEMRNSMLSDVEQHLDKIVDYYANLINKSSSFYDVLGFEKDLRDIYADEIVQLAEEIFNLEGNDQHISDTNE